MLGIVCTTVEVIAGLDGFGHRLLQPRGPMPLLLDGRNRVAVADDVAIVTPLTPEGVGQHAPVGHVWGTVQAADGRHHASQRLVGDKQCDTDASE